MTSGTTPATLSPLAYPATQRVGSAWSPCEPLGHEAAGCTRHSIGRAARRRNPPRSEQTARWTWERIRKCLAA